MQIPDGLKSYFRWFSVLGVLLMAGDMWLSAKFGWSIATEMAIIYAAVSLASGILLVFVVFFNRIGWAWMSRGLGFAWALAFAFNCWSNMGVSTANRMGEVQSAKVQQTTYAGRQSKIEESERSLNLFEGQLASLLEQNAWAATVTADGLRKQVEGLKAAEASESRLGGCGRKCRAIQDQIASIQGQIAVAEQSSDLTQRIDATKKVLAKLRADLAGTDAGISSTANQSTLYAKLISFNLAADPDAAMVTAANEGTGVATAIIVAVLASVVTLVAAWPVLMAVSSSIVTSITQPVGEQSGNRPSATSPEVPATRAYPRPVARSQTLGELACANDLRRLAAA